MTVIFETGSLVVPALTGNQTYTLSKFTGVTPKALIIFGSAVTSTAGSLDHTQLSIGFATGASNEFSIRWSDKDANATSNTNMGHFSSRCIKVPSDGGNDQVGGELVSFGTNNFTINWTDVDIQPRLGYVVIGGTDLSNVSVVEISAATSTGDQATTGVGFQPDGAIVMSVGYSGVIDTDDKSWGVTLGGISQGGTCKSICSNSVHQAMSNNERWRVWHTSRIVGMHETNAIDWSFSHVSWDTDGFTLNYDNAATNADKMWLLCFKGRDIAVAESTVPTSATTDEVTMGQDSEGVIVLTSGTTSASGTVANFANGGFGAGDDSGEAATSWSGDHDDPADTHQAFANTKVAYHLDESSNTVESQADLQTLGSNSVTLDWTSVSGSADNYLVIGLEAEDSAPSTTIPMLMQPF
jgi:hypothetical protein